MISLGSKDNENRNGEIKRDIGFYNRIFCLFEEWILKRIRMPENI